MNKITFSLFSFIFLFFSCGGMSRKGKTIVNENLSNKPGNVINCADSREIEGLIPHDSLMEGNSQPPEFIFTIHAGKVVPNQALVDTLFQADKKASEVWVYEEKVKTRDESSEYRISLYTYEEYLAEDAPGLFSVIKIRNGEKEILRLGQGEVWDIIPMEVTRENPMHFMVVHLSDRMVALLFAGHYYGSGPSDFTIIVLNGDEATCVYNKGEVYPLKIENSEKGFSAYMQDSHDEYYGTEEAPKVNYSMKFCLWLEDGFLKKRELGRIAEDLLKWKDESGSRK